MSPSMKNLPNRITVSRILLIFVFVRNSDDYV